MLKLADLYLKNPRPGLKFDGGNDDEVHRELVDLGLIVRMGAKGGSYTFTPEGVAWIRSNQAA